MRVVVAADSAVARAGLKALVEEAGTGTLAGCVGTAGLVESCRELHPDVILLQLRADEDATTMLRALEGYSVIVLTSNSAVELIRAGAGGILPLDASAEQIGIAIQAAAAGLGVFLQESIETWKSPATPSVLTARETEVLNMIAEGLANKEIAWRLGISDHTVKFHVSALLGKLGVSSRAEAVSAGIRQGVLMV